MAVKIFSKPLNADVEQVQNDLAHGLKIGEIKLYSGSIAPSRWKICDGSVISRSDYSALFGVIGTAWGGGDGETTFAVPDFKGRTPVGVGENESTGHSDHTLGQMEGEEQHTLSVAEMPSHSHSYYFDRNSGVNWGIGLAGGSAEGDRSAVASGPQARAYTLSIRNNGGSGSHNNMPPYAICTFIIYTGVDEIL